MGREMVRSPSLAARNANFNKRRKSIEKKVKELSILCGAQIVFLCFSPTGKPFLTLGHNTDLTSILERFAGIPSSEREKRRIETLESLRKSLRKHNQEIDEKYLLQIEEAREQAELNKQLSELKAKIAEHNRKLSLWMHPEKINDLAQIRSMKETLLRSLHFIRERKGKVLAGMTQQEILALEGMSNSNSAHWSGSSFHQSFQRDPNSYAVPHQELLNFNQLAANFNGHADNFNQHVDGHQENNDDAMNFKCSGL